VDLGRSLVIKTFIVDFGSLYGLRVFIIMAFQLLKELRHVTWGSPGHSYFVLEHEGDWVAMEHLPVFFSIMGLLLGLLLFK
jgi:hypothetical protein